MKRPFNRKIIYGAVVFFTVSFGSFLALGAGWFSFVRFFSDRGVDVKTDMAPNLLQLYTLVLQIACSLPMVFGEVFCLIFFSYTLNYEKAEIGTRILLGESKAMTFFRFLKEIYAIGLPSEALGVTLGFLLSRYAFGFDFPLYYAIAYLSVSLLGSFIAAVCITNSLHSKNPYVFLRRDL